MPEMTIEQWKEYFWNHRGNLSTNKDQQMFYLGFCERNSEEGKINLVGIREDGTAIQCMLAIDVTAGAAGIVEDIENWLCTLATMCSKEGLDHLQKHYPSEPVKIKEN